MTPLRKLTLPSWRKLLMTHIPFGGYLRNGALPSGTKCLSHRSSQEHAPGVWMVFESAKYQPSIILLRLTPCEASKNQPTESPAPCTKMTAYTQIDPSCARIRSWIQPPTSAVEFTYPPYFSRQNFFFPLNRGSARMYDVR